MSLKDKMKTYNFWISLASAIVLIVRIIGDKFNFFVDTSLIMDVTTGLCSIFVILGILSVPKVKTTTEQKNDTTQDKTPNENLETIITNINTSRELLKNMENQINALTPQTTIQNQTPQTTETVSEFQTTEELNPIQTPTLTEEIEITQPSETNVTTSENVTVLQECSTVLEETVIEEFEETPTFEDLKSMLQALNENFETVKKAFELYTNN